jgi:hypothetical protein
VDANTIVLVIGAVFLGVAKLYSMYLDNQREQAKIARDVITASKVEDVRKEAATAAKVVAEVKTTLEDTVQKQDDHATAADAKLKAIADTSSENHSIAVSTHTLVNNKMGLQLQRFANLSQRMADLTGEDGDKTAAKEAQDMYAEHMDKQAIVDKAQGIEPKPPTLDAK